MHKVRSRLVNFCVTEEEFERLKNAAEIQSSRCLSEFARLVMLGNANGPVSAVESESLNGRFSVFDRRPSTLESNVARLLDTLVSTNSKPQLQNQ